jgi:hypothetical protein
MEKAVAARLIEALVGLDAPINALDALSAEIPDMEERKSFRLALGNLMGQIYGDLMIPILRQHPDLDPDKDK